jgi:hypothetical protein
VPDPEAVRQARADYASGNWQPVEEIIAELDEPQPQYGFVDLRPKRESWWPDVAVIALVVAIVAVVVLLATR